MTLLGFALGIVDQIDGPGALVELSTGEAVMVDRDCLPRRAEEGDRFVYRVVAQDSCPFRSPTRRRVEPAQPGGQHEHRTPQP